MSDLTQMEKLKQQKIAEQLTYEKTLGDVTRNLVESDYNTENLLYSESEQGMVVESDIEALANYSEIKAKQRTADPTDPGELHSEQFQTGKRAIGFLNSKKSHRSMGKRKNKMKESAKRLNKVGSDARKLKENVDGMPLKERLESLEKLYDNVRKADRYFAEGIASNKDEEHKLKDKAELNYTQNLYNMYKRELDKNPGDPGLSEKVENLYWQVEQKKSSFSRNYGMENFTQHRLEEGEKLVDGLEERANTEQALKVQAEDSLKNTEKAYNENTRDNSLTPFKEFSNDSLKNYLYIKSKYSDTDDANIKSYLDSASADMQKMAFLDQKFDYYREKNKEKGTQIRKDYKNLSGKEKAKIIEGTPEFKHYSDSLRESMMQKLNLKLSVESSLSTAKDQYEMKNSLVNANFVWEKKGFITLRNVEKIERRLNIIKDHLNTYSSEFYKNVDLTKEKKEIEDTILKCELQLEREVYELKQLYIKDAKIKDDDNVTYNEIISYYKNRYQIKDKNGEVKTLQQYDMEEEIAKRIELEEKTNTTLPVGIKLNPMTMTLGVWNEARKEAMRKHYFPANSQTVDKLRQNLLNGHSASGTASDINRNIEMSLRPVKFDEKGKVLKEYEKNDEFNRKFIESHVKTTVNKDTSNDNKIFEERLPSLLDIMDEIASFKIDDAFFSIDNITKSPENLAKYTHMNGVILTFHSNVLMDRINGKLKAHCDKDPELKKKYEKADAKMEVYKTRNALFEAELGNKLSLTAEYVVKLLPDETYKSQIADLKPAYEQMLKDYKDKFGEE